MPYQSLGCISNYFGVSIVKLKDHESSSYLCNILDSLLIGIDLGLKLVVFLLLVLEVSWISIALIVGYLQFLADPTFSLEEYREVGIHSKIVMTR